MVNPFLSNLSKLSRSLLALGLVAAGSLIPVWGQTPPPAPNPLEDNRSDPLIPEGAGGRPLTPLEIRRIEEGAEAANQQAIAQLQAGNPDGAFELWYRELRLRRALGPLSEVPALGRVGQIAWEQERAPDVKIIQNRLQAIELKAIASNQLTPELRAALAVAYQQSRALTPAITAYEQIFNSAIQEGNEATADAAANELGKLYLARLDYPNAAAIYERLLESARSQGDFYSQGIYLRQLAEIYRQSAQPENAARIKEELAQSYLESQQLEKIPLLKIELGRDYEAIQQPERASQNYQEAFALAWSLQQLSVAGDALRHLGDLYRTYEQPTFALQVYQELLKVEQRSYDFYGLMNTYDRIGQIHLAQDNRFQALTAFEQALEIARSLKYREDYFLSQIQQARQP